MNSDDGYLIPQVFTRHNLVALTTSFIHLSTVLQ
jgi:hypothetical protein